MSVIIQEQIRKWIKHNLSTQYEKEAKFLLNKVSTYGKFKLSSGLYTHRYFQCCRLLMEPDILQGYINLLSDYIKKNILNNYDIHKIDFVVSPAIGGIIFGQLVAKELNLPFLFTEKVNNEIVLKRDFVYIPKETDNFLVVDDVFTTGNSFNKVVNSINKKYGSKPVAFACLVDRILNNKESSNDLKSHDFDHRIHSIFITNSEDEVFTENNIPADLNALPLITPGTNHGD